VSFADFGPTVLNLAGAEIPEQVDGAPFLGQDVSKDEVDARDESFAYADRFDEKYEFVRSLRKGRFHYIRYFQPFLPDSLQNNYRYRMLAFSQWRDLYRNGELSGPQLQFFQAKPVEALYDLKTDPHEVNNLADAPQYEEVLKDLRGRLQKKMRSLPDLSFYPESRLVSIMDDPVAFGQKQKEEIAELIDIADLALLPVDEAAAKVRLALKSENAWKRYWGAMVCSAFGDEAARLAEDVRPLLEDPSLIVRVRAAEFLGLIDEIDPQSVLTDVVNSTTNHVEATEALNSIVYFRDCHDPVYEIDPASLNPPSKGDGVRRRLSYLRESSTPAAKN